MPKPSSGIRHGAGVKGTKPKGEIVREIPQSQIDKLKGVMGHQAQGSINAKDIQAQYAKVGIKLTMQEAQEIHGAI